MGNTMKLKNRCAGHIWLTTRDGIVVGAMGSEPERFIGLPVARAKHVARYGGSRPSVKVVNGVKLHPTYNREGQLVYVTIPE